MNRPLSTSPLPLLPRHITRHLIIGLVVGALCGLLFGSYTKSVKPASMAFDMLLQTVVLLYVPLSLMHGIGSLRPKEAGWLICRVLLVLLFLWGIGIASCYLANAFIPNPATPMLEPLASYGGIFKNAIFFLIPENPFYNAIQNALPPLAIFGLILGISFMQQLEKSPLLGLLQQGIDLLQKILIWLVIVSPIKAALYAAIFFGTLEPNKLAPVGFYLFCAIIISLTLSLLIFPNLIALLTPLSYREAIRRFAFVGLASFSTGQPLIAFPIVRSILRQIRYEYNIPATGWRLTYQMVAPLAFSFAQLGNILSLLFIQFITFFYHHPLTLAQKFSLPVIAMIFSIGSPTPSTQITAAFAQQLQLPDSSLTLVENVKHVGANFRVLLSASGVLTLIILIMMMHIGKLQANWRRVIIHTTSSFGLLACLFYALIQWMPPQESFHELYMTKRIEDVISKPAKARIFYHPPQETGSFPTLANVLADKKLRIGYYPNSPPFCYFNQNGELVGYDIAFAYQLAKDLNVRLEFIPLDYRFIDTQLASGLYDIAMAQVILDAERMRSMNFSNVYYHQTNVLIVLRKRAKEFLKLNVLQESSNLRIGSTGALVEIAKKYFPQAKISSLEPLQGLKEGEIDAFFSSCTNAYLRCLQDSSLIGINFGLLLGSEYVGYAISKQSPRLQSLLNEWLQLKQQSGFTAHQHQYWISGEPNEKSPARWNIIDYFRSRS